MSRATKTWTISLPPKMVKEAEKIARDENRTKSELIREALRFYLDEKEWQYLYRYGAKKAIEKGFAESDIEKLVDEIRTRN